MIEQPVLVVERRVRGARRVEGRLDLRAPVLLAPRGVFHHEPARPPEDGVIAPERRAERAARVARRRLDVHLLERALPEDAAVGHAVERDAAGHAEARQARPAVYVARHPEDDLLDDRLDARRQIGVVLVPLRLRRVIRSARAEVRGVPAGGREERRRRVARRAEELDEPVAVRALRRPVELEVAHVELEAAVVRRPDQLPHAVDVPRRPEGRHPHDLVLTLVDLEAEERGEGAVEEPQRVREPDLLQQGELGAAPDPDGGRRPLPDPVHGEDGGLGEGRAVEGAGRVGQMVLAEHDARGREAEPLLQEVADPHLVAEPRDHRLLEQLSGPRERLHAGEQEPLELEERLLEEHDVVERGGGDAPRPEAEVDRVLGKPVVVLLAAEALLFHGGHELPVAQQHGRGVVEVAGDPEHVHQDCRCACSAMGRVAGSRGRQPRGAPGPIPSGSLRRRTSANGPRIT